MVDYGTDITWNNNPVLETVSNEDNVAQHIRNRLMTSYDELNWIYDNFGCNYKQYLGLRADNGSLEFIKNSIRQSLREDDLIGDFDLDITYAGNGAINVKIEIDGNHFDLKISDE